MIDGGYAKQLIVISGGLAWVFLRISLVKRKLNESLLTDDC